MDVIAGEVPTPKFSEFRPQDLPTFWNKSGKSKLVGSLEIQTPSGSHVQYQRDSPDMGTAVDFLLGFFLCLIIPVSLPFCFYRKSQTLQFQYGGSEISWKFLTTKEYLEHLWHCLS